MKIINFALFVVVLLMATEKNASSEYAPFSVPQLVTSESADTSTSTTGDGSVVRVSELGIQLAPNGHPGKAQRERMYHDVWALSGASGHRFYKNTDALNSAAEYIKSEWRKLGLKVYEQRFEADGVIYKNVMVSFGPEEGKRIVVGAHYDVCGDRPGADDNASGVAGLLELSRLLAEQAGADRFGKLQSRLTKRIDLVAYTLEEPPFFRTGFMGSSVHARWLKSINADVELMICLEMIGYFTDKPNSQDYPVGMMKWMYPTTGNFIGVIGNFSGFGAVSQVKDLMRTHAKIDVQALNAPSFIRGVDFSDHLNYWKEGFDAVMITDTSFYRNENYHEETDTIETLDFSRMSETISGVFAAVTRL